MNKLHEAQKFFFYTLPQGGCLFIWTPPLRGCVKFNYASPSGEYTLLFSPTSKGPNRYIDSIQYRHPLGGFKNLLAEISQAKKDIENNLVPYLLLQAINQALVTVLTCVKRYILRRGFLSHSLCASSMHRLYMWC